MLAVHKATLGYLLKAHLLDAPIAHSNTGEMGALFFLTFLFSIVWFGFAKAWIVAIAAWNMISLAVGLVSCPELLVPAYGDVVRMIKQFTL